MRNFAKKLTALPLIAGLLATMLLLPATAAKDDNHARTVYVGYYENEIFEEGAKEGAVKSGYAYEYYLKLSEYTGWDYEYVYGDYDALYHKLLAGEIDLLAGLAKTDEREGLIGYPKSPMGNEGYYLVKHASDTEITENAATLSGKTTGVLKSAIETLLRSYYEANHVTGDIVVFEDYAALFSAFDAGEIDILAAEGNGAADRADAQVVTSFGKSDYYLCVSIGRDDLLAQLNEAQAAIEADAPDYISFLRNKYYSASLHSRTMTAEEKEWAAAHDVLTVGYLNNYLPYSATTADGKVNGIVKDLVPAIFDELNITDTKITYVGYDNYEKMVGDIVADEIDVAFPIGGGLYYSEENGIYQSAAVVSATTDIAYAGSYNDDVTSHFAVNENNKMQYYYIITNFPDAKITLFPSIDDCLDAVLKGKTTATTLNGLRANNILKNSRYKGLYLTQLSKMDERAFGVKIGDEGLLRLMNRGITLLGSDYAQNMAYRYSEQLYEYTSADFIREHAYQLMAGVLALVAFFVILIIRDMKRSRYASRMKSDFLSNMSHEIRTPITAILGMNELIRRESDNADILKYSDNISKAGDNLLDIINNVLDLSKIESGNMEVVKKEYLLFDMLLELCVMSEYRADAKGLIFDMEIDAALPNRLYGDVGKVRQATLNLLTNAIKYTEEGRVKLTVALVEQTADAAAIEIRIADTGIGIKQEDMDRLFREFDRLDLEKTKNIEGTGLGLAITRHMLDLMGSRLDVESTYGEGSVFSFVIRQEVRGDEPVGDFEKRRRTNELLIEQKKNISFTAKDARVLIVDDTPMNIQVISGLMKRTGMQIDAANSGAECLEKFASGHYDLVFLDQRMPGMDGVETLMQIKKNFPKAYKETPIISLTANVLAGTKEEMLKAGFTDYLSKPVDAVSLDKVILTYLAKEKVEVGGIVPEAGSASGAASGGGFGRELSSLPAALKDVGGLNLKAGLTYCGEAEDYLDALTVFAASVEERAAQLTTLAENADMPGYALLIHSIKSISFSIGADELSHFAKRLEKAADDGDAEVIKAETPAFTAIYKRLKTELDKALEEE